MGLELGGESALQHLSSVNERVQKHQYTTTDAAQNKVTPEDLWKGTKTVLQEVARETIGSVKS